MEIFLDTHITITGHEQMIPLTLQPPNRSISTTVIKKRIDMLDDALQFEFIGRLEVFERIDSGVNTRIKKIFIHLIASELGTRLDDKYPSQL